MVNGSVATSTCEITVNLRDALLNGDSWRSAPVGNALAEPLDPLIEDLARPGPLRYDRIGNVGRRRGDLADQLEQYDVCPARRVDGELLEPGPKFSCRAGRFFDHDTTSHALVRRQRSRVYRCCRCRYGLEFANEGILGLSRHVLPAIGVAIVTEEQARCWLPPELEVPVVGRQTCELLVHSAAQARTIPPSVSRGSIPDPMTVSWKLLMSKLSPIVSSASRRSFRISSLPIM